MKRAITLFCLAFLGLSAQGQIKKVKDMNLIGTDISSIIRYRRADIMVSHGFAGRWSVSAKAGLYMVNPYASLSDEEYSHRSELTLTEERSDCPDYISGYISVEHWSRECYRGPFVSVGCRYGLRKGFDCTVSVGCLIRIWKNLAARLSYETDILSSYRSGRTEGEGTTIGIYMIF